MKLEGTKDKLEEARFFLRHLKAAQPQIPFRFCLSAFLNAAYGVTTYLKAEIVAARRQQPRTQGKKPSGKQITELFYTERDQWKEGLQDQQALWDKMEGHREADTHNERVKTSTKEKAVPQRIHGSYAFAPQAMMLRYMAESSPEIAEKEGLRSETISWNYSEEHYPIGPVQQQSMVSDCTEYVDLLANLIAHFEQALMEDKLHVPQSTRASHTPRKEG